MHVAPHIKKERFFCVFIHFKMLAHRAREISTKDYKDVGCRRHQKKSTERNIKNTLILHEMDFSFLVFHFFGILSNLKAM